MRLIDADSIRGYAKYIKTNEKFEPYIMIDDLSKLLDEQLTAYSVDKVVAELEEMKTIKGSMKTVTCRKWDYGTVNRTIEIVKQGVVSDDVCEAKQGKWIFDKFTAKYGNPYRCSCCNEEFGDTYNYCPNCGVSMN